MSWLIARRRVHSIICVALLAALSLGAAAQNLFDFDDWMQRIDDGSQSLQRHIVARDAKAASGAAQEMEELYGLMEEFFEKRGDSRDAVRWSREGRAFAARAQADIAAGRFVSARRNALAIAHGCRDCHFNYKPL
jgi:hypothetical protein